MQVEGEPRNICCEAIGILEDGQQRILDSMRILSSLTESAVDAPLNREDRAMLQSALNYFREIVPRYRADEEDSLFPLLRRHAEPHGSDVCEYLASLANDHRWAKELHLEMDAIGSRWLAAGALRANDRVRLRALTRSLSRFYAQHIASEQRSLFPAARQMLSLLETERLRSEMVIRHGTEQLAGSGLSI